MFRHLEKWLCSSQSWGSRFNSIVNQCLLAIITSLLMELFLHEKMGKNCFHDEKALQKQVIRQSTDYDSTDRLLRTLSVYRYTSKVSKQVVRFLKYNFSKTASQILYDKQLKPMLLAYLWFLLDTVVSVYIIS